jgi:hypothetical protein
MSTYASLYWLTRLSDLVILFGWLLAISIILIVVPLIVRCISIVENCYGESTKRITGRLMKLGTVLAPIFILIVTFLPTKQDVIFIIAGGKTIEFVKHDKAIQDIPGHTTQLIDAYLTKELSRIDSLSK